MPDDSNLLRLIRAVEFAAAKHCEQRRKGKLREPYVNHVIEVASLLAEATEGKDLNLLIAGLLHDTVEDTDTTAAEIEALFGQEVKDLVLEVTDDKTLPKKTRKLLQIEHTPHKSDGAKLLKLADKISNMNAITVSPPEDWDNNRKADYFRWAASVVNSCRGVNQTLEQTFDEVFRAGMKRLEVADPPD